MYRVDRTRKPRKTRKEIRERNVAQANKRKNQLAAQGVAKITLEANESVIQILRGVARESIPQELKRRQSKMSDDRAIVDRWCAERLNPEVFEHARELPAKHRLLLDYARQFLRHEEKVALSQGQLELEGASATATIFGDQKSDQTAI